MESPVGNLCQLLEQAANTSAGGIITYAPEDNLRTSRRVTYSQLLDRAMKDAEAIHRINPSRSKVLLHFDEHSHNMRWFWAVVVAGHVPVVSPPFSKDTGQRQKHLKHLHELLQSPLVLTSAKLVPEFLGTEDFDIRPIEALEAVNGALHHSFPEAQNGTLEHSCDTGFSKQRDDLAALMLTSGSTGNAKAVCLRHGQILTALNGKSRYHEISRSHVFLNWIGFDHVANLCEVHLHAMSMGADQIHAQAADLLADPISFLCLIDKHRVGYTFAPNFFLGLLKRQLENTDYQVAPKTRDLDLSCLKALISGGEANVVKTCATVTEQLHRYRACGDFVRPGFGMTETCAGSIYGKSCPTYDLENNLEFASLGRSIPGLKTRIVTENGTEAAVNEAGSLQLAGPILFGEYYRNKIATKEAFTADGWFITGDRAMKDWKGNLNLAGRAKESIIINGVKHYPHELEAAIEEALIPGTTPSYNVVFPHRPKKSETESLCIVYLPTYNPDDIKALVETAEAITKVSTMICGVRPWAILPLDKSHLPKSSLGKISRAKVSTAFAKGLFQEIQEKTTIAIQTYRMAKRETPSSWTEKLILSLLEERFNLPNEEIGINSSLFDLGFTSVDLIAFKKQLEEGLQAKEEIPLILILENPSIRMMANAIEVAVEEKSIQHVYSPVVTLQAQGKKTPLWLVHPGVGEVLVFLSLSKYITDRPVHALRARGFNKGEECFSSIQEVVSVYHESIKRKQPKGPYAIAGYSFGAMLAFEISKVLESQNDEVRFLGSFNLPPHIKHRMKQLDWVEVALNLSYFLGLMTEEHAHEISPDMHKLSNDEVLKQILHTAPQSRLTELSLDKTKLSTWSSLAHAMQDAAREYDPFGSVAGIDIFVADPLANVAESKEDWKVNHLNKWRDFSRSEP